MPGITDLQETLRRVMREIDTSKAKKEKEKKEAAKLEEALPQLTKYVEAQSSCVSGILKTLRADLERVSAATRFCRRFDEDVRAILEGEKIRSAFTGMESAIRHVQTDRDRKNQAASGAEKEIRTLQSRAEELKRRIREQQETGVQG